MSVDFLRPRPAFGCAKNNHRPLRQLSNHLGTCFVLDGPDFREHRFQSLGHYLMYGHRVGTLDKIGFVTITDKQALQLPVADPSQNRGIGDFITVQVQDGQHCPVVHRIKELVGVPGCGQRSGLRFPITHHDRYNQIRIVEGGAKGMGKTIAQLARPRV